MLMLLFLLLLTLYAKVAVFVAIFDASDRAVAFVVDKLVFVVVAVAIVVFVVVVVVVFNNATTIIV